MLQTKKVIIYLLINWRSLVNDNGSIFSHRADEDICGYCFINKIFLIDMFLYIMFEIQEIISIELGIYKNEKSNNERDDVKNN